MLQAWHAYAYMNYEAVLFFKQQHQKEQKDQSEVPAGSGDELTTDDGKENTETVRIHDNDSTETVRIYNNDNTETVRIHDNDNIETVRIHDNDNTETVRIHDNENTNSTNS